MDKRKRQSFVMHPSGPASVMVRKCHLCVAGPLSVSSKSSAWPEETREWVKSLSQQSIPSNSVLCMCM